MQNDLQPVREAMSLPAARTDFLRQDPRFHAARLTPRRPKGDPNAPTHSRQSPSPKGPTEGQGLSQEAQSLRKVLTRQILVQEAFSQAQSLQEGSHPQDQTKRDTEAVISVLANKWVHSSKPLRLLLYDAECGERDELFFRARLGLRRDMALSSDPIDQIQYLEQISETEPELFAEPTWWDG